jgi:peptide deformylase
MRNRQASNRLNFKTVSGQTTCLDPVRSDGINRGNIMAVREILQLGNPQLYMKSKPVERSELPSVRTIADDLHDTMVAFRDKYGFGRAITAPQIGIMKRIVYSHTARPLVLINPELYDLSGETFALWDNCMSFPDLLVKVIRHKTCSIQFLNLDGELVEHKLEGDAAELLQHECDHLDGILAVQRAIDDKSIALRSQKDWLIV